MKHYEITFPYSKEDKAILDDWLYWKKEAGQKFGNQGQPWNEQFHAERNTHFGWAVHRPKGEDKMIYKIKNQEVFVQFCLTFAELLLVTFKD